MRCWALLVLAVALGGAVAAQEVRTVEVLLLPNPPYTYAPEAKGGPVTGFLPDLFGVMRVPGFRWSYQVGPWARVLAETKDDTTGLVVLPTLTRIPEREGSFKWVAPLNEPRYFFIGKGPADPRLSMADLKNRPIAVLLNNLADDWLHGHGFTKITEVSTLDQMVKMTSAGRVDFLLKDVTSLSFFLKSNGLAADELVLGPEVKELAQPLYIAGSLQMDPALARGLANELERLRKSGTLEKIWKRWQ